MKYNSLEVSTKIINNQQSLLTTHCWVGYWLPASSRGMTLIRRQMLTHFPTVTKSTGFQPEPLLTAHYTLLTTHNSLLTIHRIRFQKVNTLIPQHFDLTLFISSWATKSCSGFCHVRFFTYLSVAIQNKRKS